jgi:hypothetical protein
MAEADKTLRVPPRLTKPEQIAFHEGYNATREERRNRPIALEIRQMLGGSRFVGVIRRLVQSSPRTSPQRAGSNS